jgi:hypothetical protein
MEAMQAQGCRELQILAMEHLDRLLLALELAAQQAVRVS